MHEVFQRVVTICLASFALAQSAAVSHPIIHHDYDIESARDSYGIDGRGKCGTSNPTEAAARESDRIVEKWRTRGTNGIPEDGGLPIVILTNFNVITNASIGNVSSTDIENQMNVLNEAYSPHFQFSLNETTYTDNSNWFADRSYDIPMKTELRKGGCHVLNVYTTGGKGFLGFSNFPEECNTGDGPWVKDGAVVDYRTLPGGEYPLFNLGNTLVHEVGHWLGLYHTFEGGCRGDGDHVKDTPPHEVSFECDKNLDTCGNRKGLDPVTNFMSYSPDTCMETFTSGQFERMIALWNEYRKDGDKVKPTNSPTPEINCKKNQIEFEIQIKTDKYGEDTSFRLQKSNRRKKAWKSIVKIKKFESNAVASIKQCLSKRLCYRYKVFDVYGDGICCDHGKGKITTIIDGEKTSVKFDSGNEKVRIIGKRCIWDKKR